VWWCSVEEIGGGEKDCEREDGESERRVRSEREGEHEREKKNGRREGGETERSVRRWERMREGFGWGLKRKGSTWHACTGTYVNTLERKEYMWLLWIGTYVKRKGQSGFHLLGHMLISN
jgi:hypothetical protein